MNVNWIDLILSGIFIYGAIVGFKRGLVREVASLFGLFISIISVFYFSDQLSNLIEIFLNLTSTVAYIISCLVIFLTVIYLVSYLAKIITKALSIVALGFLNRVTGLIFGLFKWIIISSSIIFIINKILFFNEFSEQLKGDQMKTSIMYSPLSEVGAFIFEKINTNTNEEEWEYL
ncbi:MAG: membrane protein required for colicin V production [Candidatus Marivariicella framensis]|jgi:membrane protein required for colicin V production|tara:strand:- start:1126 stop:1650 length:525 start_codon:yes stop_codon:yes gene_type:complete